MPVELATVVAIAVVCAIADTCAVEVRLATCSVLVVASGTGDSEGVTRE